MPKLVPEVEVDPILDPTNEHTRREIFWTARTQAGMSESAAKLGVSSAGFARFVASNPSIQSLIAKGQAHGKRQLRDTMFMVALDSDHRYQGQMLVFLGKGLLRIDAAVEPETIPGTETEEDPKSLADLAVRALAEDDETENDDGFGPSLFEIGADEDDTEAA